MADYLEFLTCAVCLEVYNDPYALPCLHSFCKKCLEQLNRNISLTNCPECRKPATFAKIQPDFRIQQLVQHFQSNKIRRSLSLNICGQCESETCSNETNYCKDCDLVFCIDCTILHKTKDKTKHHSVFSFVQQTLLYCADHDKKYEYFCNETSCKALLCVSCAEIHHRNHRIQTLKEQKVQLSEKILKNVETAKEKIENIQVFCDKSLKLWQIIEEKCNEFEVSSRNKRDFIIEQASITYGNEIASMIELKSSLKEKYSDNNNELCFFKNQLVNLMLESKESLLKKSLSNLQDLNKNVENALATDCVRFYQVLEKNYNPRISSQLNQDGIKQAIIEHIGRLTLSNKEVGSIKVSNSKVKSSFWDKIDPEILSRHDLGDSPAFVLDIFCDEKKDTVFVLYEINGEIIFVSLLRNETVKKISIGNDTELISGNCLAMLENGNMLVKLTEQILEIDVDSNLIVSNEFHLLFGKVKSGDLICSSPCRKLIYFYSFGNCIYKHRFEPRRQERVYTNNKYTSMSVSENLDDIAFTNYSRYSIDLFSFSQQKILRSFRLGLTYGVSFLLPRALIASRYNSFSILNVANGELLREFKIFDYCNEIQSRCITKSAFSMVVVAHKQSIFKVKLV